MELDQLCKRDEKLAILEVGDKILVVHTVVLEKGA